MEYSSSEEDYEKFRDAVDNEMFAIRNKKPDENIVKRAEKFSEGNHAVNMLHVTEEFKTHLAKKLFTKLESEIEYCDQIVSDNLAVCPKAATGIRLFTSSDISDCVDDDDNHTLSRRKRKIPRRLKNRELDDVDNNMTTKDKIKLATVTPEWVLQREGVKCWTERKNRVTVLKPIGKAEYEVVGMI